MMKLKKAFTLVELLVVISIIAILLAVLIPALSMARAQGRRIICASNLHSIGMGMGVYASNYDGKLIPPHPEVYGMDYPYASYVAYDKNYTEKGASRSGRGRLLPFQLAILYDKKICPGPEIFYCPSQMDNVSNAHAWAKTFTLKYYVEKGVMPWGSAIPRDDALVRTSYNYWTHKKIKLSDVSRKPVSLDNVGEWGMVPHRKNKKSNPSGINVLYGDAHVNFCTNKELWDKSIWDNNPGNHMDNFMKIMNILER